MRSHYKRIGDFVTQIKLKNTDDSISDLKGINISKCFMPSVANVNGTDLSKYRVVKKNQFAFNPMHVGRDEILPIARLENESPIIVSPAYVVFEVQDEEKLLPEYLMMWCRRSEFDRNAWFMTDNSVRGGFSWSDFCDMELPVPSIDKQREVVREYNVVNDRIALNEKFTQKLEDTAQAIYKQWFVDFNFPISREYAESIGKPELEGKPYQSSGGDVGYCEQLEQYIPKGWNCSVLNKLATNVDNRGKTPPHFKHKTEYPLLEIASLKTEGRIPSFANCSKFICKETYDTWFRSGHPKPKDTLFSTVGSLAQMKVFWGDMGSIAQNIVGFRCIDDIGLYIYQYLKNSIEELLAYEIGSVQASIKVSHLSDFKVMLPNINQLRKYELVAEVITKYSFRLNKQSDLLGGLKEILLQKMSKV